MDGSDDLTWLCEQMIRIENNWTKQVQDQQTRLNSVMTVNGFLLAFLAATGFGVTKQIGTGWYLYPYYSTLILLCIALLFGLLAFVPRTGYAKLSGETPGNEPDYWLDSQAIWLDYQKPRNLNHVLGKIAKSAGSNQEWNRGLRSSLERRKRLLYTQLVSIALATLSLMGAIVGIAYKVIPS